MFLIITRNFPPDIGGMQNLMHGLTKSLSKLNLLKFSLTIMKIIQILMIMLISQSRELGVQNYLENIENLI